MTTQEFSNTFDTLIDSTGFTFNEYEKSIFLTQAQNQLVKEWYSGLSTSGAFETNEELRALLYGLIVSDTTSEQDLTSLSESEEYGVELDNNCKTYNLKSDVFYIIEECAYIKYKNSTKRVNVMPVRHDQYNVIRDNPFKNANKRRVLRLDSNNNSSRKVILISEYPIESYQIRYLKSPNPIILTPLEDGLNIKGFTNITECELGEITHRLILDRAIQIAIASKSLAKANQ